MSAVEKFPVLLSEAEEESSAVPPCFSDEGINVCPTSLLPWSDAKVAAALTTFSSTYTSGITTSTSLP